MSRRAQRTILARPYATGLGVLQDDVQAVAWYRRAAERGYGEAQFGIGLMYSKGRGIAKDEVEAHMWLQLAAIQEFGSAAAALRDLEKDMTTDQIAEAERQTNAWTPTE